MYLRKRRLPSGTQETDATVEIDEIEFTVKVTYSWVPPEPDVGEPGGIDIEGVLIDNRDIMSELTEVQLETIANDILDYNTSMDEAYEEDARWED